MRFSLSLLTTVCVAILFTSCNDDDSSDDMWRLDNEAQFAAIAANPEYTRINSQSAKGFIMYRELKSGNGEKPFFTDQVKVLYTGWYKNIWSKPDTYVDEKGNIISNKVIFDSTNIALTIPVSGVVDGFSTALQHMQEGDKWEVWIPWWLGYGESGSGSIKGYTTLVFEIELVKVVG